MAILSGYGDGGNGADAPPRDGISNRVGDAATIASRARPQGRSPDDKRLHDDAKINLAGIAKLILDTRRARSDAFPDKEFDDAAWNMTLELYAKHVAGRHSTIMSLCAAAGAPPTSALRSINLMVARGNFIRQRDPADARRVFILPAGGLVEAVERYLADFGDRIHDI